MGGGLRLVLAGLSVGVVCALGVSRLISTFLYHVKPGDPVTVVSVCAILLAVALAATGQPALRAAAGDPIQSLREE